jgi:uncharacterized protein YjeT (DUF2065 family)
MHDFVIAIGLVFVIEGLVFAAFPGSAKRAVMIILEAPEGALRIVGLLSALLGLVLIWLMRG